MMGGGLPFAGGGSAVPFASSSAAGLSQQTTKAAPVSWLLFTGFPIKDARFSKLKNILFLLSDEKEGKIIENIDLKYFSNLASFVGNPFGRKYPHSWA